MNATLLKDLWSVKNVPETSNNYLDFPEELMLECAITGTPHKVGEALDAWDKRHKALLWNTFTGFKAANEYRLIVAVLPEITLEAVSDLEATLKPFIASFGFKPVRSRPKTKELSQTLPTSSFPKNSLLRK